MAYTGFYYNGIEEWSQFFRRDNWFTFHPVLLEFEDDRMMGGVEMTLVVFGLGFRIRYNYAQTEQVSEIVRRAEEFKEQFKDD